MWALDFAKLILFFGYQKAGQPNQPKAWSIPQGSNRRSVITQSIGLYSPRSIREAGIWLAGGEKTRKQTCKWPVVLSLSSSKIGKKGRNRKRKKKRVRIRIMQSRGHGRCGKFCSHFPNERIFPRNFVWGLDCRFERSRGVLTIWQNPFAKRRLCRWGKGCYRTQAAHKQQMPLFNTA